MKSGFKGIFLPILVLLGWKAIDKPTNGTTRSRSKQYAQIIQRVRIAGSGLHNDCLTAGRDGKRVLGQP
ncbi:MAG: hypothetical protein JRI30_05085 [Deltaproteobacteria bacterium]|nr:hypothetical protein [Deltaproteobacteria bacterium]